MEAVRQEAERRDYYGGTVMLHSVSGGTGSGECHRKNHINGGPLVTESAYHIQCTHSEKAVR